jgi:MoaA/NifB/PqqE/SkfB family radical SAM enzyme
LARDPEYAHWAATLPTKACQITFFGLEENTDWGMRRRGAFRDQLLATQRCIEARIVPRWQLFITKRCLHELDDFLRLIDTLELQRSLEAVGQSFEVFIGGMSPEGSGYEIDPLRPAEEDLRFIPQALTSMARDGTAMLGKPEYMLLDALKDSELPPNLSAGINGLFVDPGFHVYPNLAEPAEWWRLGNLKTDGVDAVMKSYLHETTPGMRMNRTITVGELARRYGNRNSRKLYHEDDLICRFVHQWGLDITGGENDA